MAYRLCYCLGSWTQLFVEQWLRRIDAHPITEPRNSKLFSNQSYYFYSYLHRRHQNSIIPLFSVLDIDECANEDENDCDANALCTNTEGSYVCRCMKGYEGDGSLCTGIQLFGFSLTQLLVDTCCDYKWLS